jgi:hypothetical protein
MNGEPSSAPRAGSLRPLGKLLAGPLVLLAGFACGALTGVSGSAATQVSDLQAQATQVSQELILEELQVGAYEHQYQTDVAQVAQDQAQIDTVKAQITLDVGRVQTEQHRLSQEAVNTYINAGSVGIDRTLGIFEGTQGVAITRGEYEKVAIGNTDDTLAQLHTAEVQLQTNEATLRSKQDQDIQIQNSARSASNAAQSTASELAARQATIQGQLAQAIAADRAQQEATAAAAVAASGGPVPVAGGIVSVSTNPSLPPFLQCVLQHESGGNYQAVSPDGQYMGGFQFSQSTWNEAALLAGLPGLVGVPPNQAPPADQNALAIALYNADGKQPWLDGC